MPVTLLVGIDVVDRDRLRRTIRINQKTYVGKLKKKYGNKLTIDEHTTVPCYKSQAGCFRAQDMPKGTAETEVRKLDYLEM